MIKCAEYLNNNKKSSSNIQGNLYEYIFLNLDLLNLLLIHTCIQRRFNNIYKYLTILV